MTTKSGTSADRCRRPLPTIRLLMLWIVTFADVFCFKFIDDQLTPAEATRLTNIKFLTGERCQRAVQIYSEKRSCLLAANGNTVQW